MSTKQLWPSKNRANAQAIVDWLLKTRNNNGWLVSPKLDIALQELTYAADQKHRLTEGLASRILGEMYTDDERTLEEFEARFSRYRSELHRRKNTESLKWRFYIPFPVRIHPDLQSRIQVKVIDTEFRLISFATLRRQVGAHLAQDIRSLRVVRFFLINRDTTSPSDLPRQFLTVHSNGLEWNEAWTQIEPAFDAFRGLLELTIGLGRWNWSSHEKPRRKIPHPLWMVAVNERNEHEPIRFSAPAYNEPRLYELTNSDYVAFKKNASIFKEESTDNHSLYSLLIDCLRLYAQAVDAEYRHSCLLGLWQLAEAITQAQTVSGKTEVVVNRLSWLGEQLDLVASGYFLTLSSLATKRNDIVHRGLHDVSDRDINTLKLACERALLWLIQHREDLPTKMHLDRYYRLREVGNAHIEVFSDTLKFIQKERQ